MDITVLQHQLDLLQLAIYYLKKKRKRKQRKRRVRCGKSWIGRQRQFGLYDQLMVELRNEDQRAFKNFLRMPPEMYDELLERVGPRIAKRHTSCRAPLEPGLKLALTLRHLASGSSYMSMRYGWRVPHNTQSVIVREVCQAIIDEYLPEVMNCPTIPQEWLRVSEKFLQKWNFPHTCGALDGKHIACKCPFKSGSQYYNYKHFYSIVLFALVDADYKFIFADLGGTGSASDAQIYNDSELKELAESGSLGLPFPDPLPHDYQDVPYFFVGDDAFALRETMMKPYSKRNLNDDERIFNYRLSRARRVVENAFGILANRFQVLLTTMRHKLSTVKVIVKACIVLHNLMRIRYPSIQNEMIDRPEDINTDFIAGAWRQDKNLEDTHIVSGSNTSRNKEGKKIRNLLKHWVNSEAGAVPWQDQMI